ncbi:MAG TPA: hypothetical protein ENI80_01320 [Acidiferrobacteraceae bacterium]|nr:hypothetical protein [Acidiferrobacteraceae bacterium]
MKLLAHYYAVADLFDYPDLEYPQRVRKVIDLLDGNYPEAVAELERFQELLPAQELRTMQELFTRSFDVQAATTLDIGYVMFGDDYKRGELLANLNREHLAAKNDCGRELADHLPNILRLLAKVKDKDFADELVQEIIAPALSMMISEFSPDRVEKKNEAYKKHYKTLIELPTTEQDVATFYQFSLRGLREVLKRDFEFEEKTMSLPTSDFLQSVIKENEIEVKADTTCFQNSCS